MVYNRAGELYQDRVERYHRWTADEIDRAAAQYWNPRASAGRWRMYRLCLPDDVLKKISMESRASAAGRLPVTPAVQQRGATR